MAKARRILAFALLTTSVADLAMALFMSHAEQPLVLIPGLVGILAGYMMLRQVRYWTAVAAIAVLPYFFYGADIPTKMLVRGEWHAVVSMFKLPLKDPDISILAKLSFVWFQGLLPLLVIAVFALCALAWLRALRTRRDELQREV